MAFRRIYKLLLAWVLIFLLLTVSSLQCGHGIRGSGRRMRPEKIKPLVFKQHVPNVSEGTLGASGQSEGKITRNSPKFKELVTMDDPNIVFRDEEGDGSDRVMSKRCKDKLKSLSIAVMNHWPGVKLRVTEAWDEDGTHTKDSLHYEGRAVDITTSDRDRSKYPMLASLAVAAGFDWVYYESRGHIHCSVKSDNSEAIKRGGGCFPGDVKVRTESGQTKNMSSLQVGEKVLTMTDGGKLAYSEVIMFMDRDTKSQAVYKKLILDNGKYLTLTADHLVYVSTAGHYDVDRGFDDAVVEFASNVKLGDFVRVVANGDVIASKVVDIQTETKDGVYAPLTLQGTIVANDVVASCYAVVHSHSLAHGVFAPVRFIHNLKDYFGIGRADTEATTKSSQGIHWYPNIFHKIAPYVLNKNMFLKKL